MKIREIIAEAYLPPAPSVNDMHDDGHGPMDPDWTEDDVGFGDHREEQEMQLSSNADQKMINAVKKASDEYKGQGHAQVEILPFISKVIEYAGKNVKLADLLAINKKSAEIRSLIDSIDDKKIKFKNMSVKNEDPGKQKEENNATLDGMAGRAASRDRSV